MKVYNALNMNAIHVYKTCIETFLKQDFGLISIERNISSLSWMVNWGQFSAVHYHIP